MSVSAFDQLRVPVAIAGQTPRMAESPAASSPSPSKSASASTSKTTTTTSAAKRRDSRGGDDGRLVTKSPWTPPHDQAHELEPRLRRLRRRSHGIRPLLLPLRLYGLRRSGWPRSLLSALTVEMFTTAPATHGSTSGRPMSLALASDSNVRLFFDRLAAQQSKHLPPPLLTYATGPSASAQAWRQGHALGEAPLRNVKTMAVQDLSAMNSQRLPIQHPGVASLQPQRPLPPRAPVSTAAWMVSASEKPRKAVKRARRRTIEDLAVLGHENPPPLMEHHRVVQELQRLQLENEEQHQLIRALLIENQRLLAVCACGHAEAAMSSHESASDASSGQEDMPEEEGEEAEDDERKKKEKKPLTRRYRSHTRRRQVVRVRRRSPRAGSNQDEAAEAMEDEASLVKRAKSLAERRRASLTFTVVDGQEMVVDHKFDRLVQEIESDLAGLLGYADVNVDMDVDMSKSMVDLNVEAGLSTEGDDDWAQV